MNTFKAVATSAALLLAPLAQAQEAEFSEVDVAIQLAEPETSNALGLWPTVEEDLEAIMRQRISTIYNPNGLVVTVSVNEISQDGNKTLSDNGEFNTLSGVAIIRENASGPVVEVEAFSLRAQPWQVNIEDGMLVLPDKADFYNAMLNNFADEMVTAINAE